MEKTMIFTKEHVLIFKKILFAEILVLLFIGCTDRSTPYHRSNKVLTDSVFYSTFQRISPLKTPCSFMSIPNDSELVKLTFVQNIWETEKRTTDSLFLVRHICEYDNFCRFQNMAEQEVYELFQGVRLNDSIYIITYFDMDIRDVRWGHFDAQPKIFMLSYNVNKSEKPVDKLVLYGHEKGAFELWSTIDSDFKIETNHHISMKYFQKPILAYTEDGIDLYFNIRKYHLKASGEFELISYLSGFRPGVQNEDEHFSYSENDTVILDIGWEKDRQENIKQVAIPFVKGLIIDNKFILTDTT